MGSDGSTRVEQNSHEKWGHARENVKQVS